jgi:hypothetical protein
MRPTNGVSCQLKGQRPGQNTFLALEMRATKCKFIAKALENMEMMFWNINCSYCQRIAPERICIGFECGNRKRKS